MSVIARLLVEVCSASITDMIRHYVARQGAGDRRSPT